MWNIITLDGFFDGEKPWELPFHAAVWGDELEKLSLEQLRAADFVDPMSEAPAIRAGAELVIARQVCRAGLCTSP